ncbi:MAG: hypothetical protein DRJ03_22165 [Chloroflexi bacterium]|nr:MAG: hypothetical protein DRJ03_22165 [Chloroflexota bacterium]
MTAKINSTNPSSGTSGLGFTLEGLEHLEERHVRFLQKLYNLTGQSFHIKITQNCSWGWAYEDGRITVPAPWLYPSDQYWKVTVLHEVTHLVVELDENHNVKFWEEFYRLACALRLKKYAVKHMKEFNKTSLKVLKEIKRRKDGGKSKY